MKLQFSEHITKHVGAETISRWEKMLRDTAMPERGRYVKIFTHPIKNGAAEITIPEEGSATPIWVQFRYTDSEGAYTELGGAYFNKNNDGKSQK